MTRPWLAGLAMLAFLIGADAGAHRLDDYLQATLLTVGPDRIAASMRLVPGEAVAAAVVFAIGADRKGRFSLGAQRAYADSVLGDLSIEVDGHLVRPRLIAWRVPAAAELRGGLGEIRIDYAIDLPPATGDRSVTLANRHLAGLSRYMVDALAPTRADIVIVGQKRNASQSEYELAWRQENHRSANAR